MRKEISMLLFPLFHFVFNFRHVFPPLLRASLKVFHLSEMVSRLFASHVIDVCIRFID